MSDDPPDLPLVPAHDEEPKNTGVEDKQVKAPVELELVPPDNRKAYSALMSETLEAYLVSGILGASVPFLMTHQKYAEERFRNVDNERKQALRDLKAMSDQCHSKDILATKYSVRLKIGERDSLIRNVLITIGGTVLGAGLAQQVAAGNGVTLLVVGGLLLLTGWISAIADHIRNKKIEE